MMIRPTLILEVTGTLNPRSQTLDVHDHSF